MRIPQDRRKLILAAALLGVCLIVLAWRLAPSRGPAVDDSVARRAEEIRASVGRAPAPPEAEEDAEPFEPTRAPTRSP